MQKFVTSTYRSNQIQFGVLNAPNWNFWLTRMYNLSVSGHKTFWWHQKIYKYGPSFQFTKMVISKRENFFPTFTNQTTQKE